MEFHLESPILGLCQNVSPFFRHFLAALDVRSTQAMRECLCVVVMLEDHLAVATGPYLLPSGIMRSDNLAWLPNSLDGSANPGGGIWTRAVHWHNITLVER